MIKTNLALHQYVTDRFHKMGLLFLMYISQKIFLCFSWTLLPILLRKQGATLGSIGFTALVYSPWALKFLYASVVDRFYSTNIGKRKSWIIPLLFLSWAMLALLALFFTEKNLKLLLPAVFLLNLIFATIDIAVDGYATDILSPDERPWGNAVQLIGYMIGYMLGTGVFLIIYQNQGWQATLMIITIVQLVLMMPIVLHKEISPVFTNEAEKVSKEYTTNTPSICSFIKQPTNLWFLLFVSLIVVFEHGGNQLRVPMLVDMGLNPSSLGQLNIWAGSLTSIIGAIIGGTLLNRLGIRRVFILCCLGAAALSFFSAILSKSISPILWQIGIMIGFEKFIVGIIMVFTYSTIMTLSVGPQSATNYAILSSANQFVMLSIMPITGNLCDIVGYFSLYIGLGVFSLLFIFMGNYLLCHQLESLHR